jgi:4-hydroxy-2-oxoglutarate aldolase
MTAKPGNRLRLAGVFPPIPTPFDENGDLHLQALQDNLARWNAEPLQGYVVGGSNGEFVLLTPPERLAVVREARETIADGRLLIAGAGAESTRLTLEQADQMAGLGADALLVVTPSYYKAQMTTGAFVEHYTRVADRSPIPILLYNVPANTGLNLPIEAVIELAAHPNIAGLKDSGGDIVRIGGLVARSPQDFQVLAGSAGFFLPALSVGAVGVVPALGNLAAVQLAELHSHFLAGEQAQAATLQRRLLAPNRAVTSQYGVPGLKAGLEMRGYYGGPVRGPLLPLTAAERADLEQTLGQAGIL